MIIVHAGELGTYLWGWFCKTFDYFYAIDKLLSIAVDYLIIS
jgi:hypothetical protein